jgi:hypothetical protein
LDVRLTSLLCKKNTAAKSKEVNLIHLNKQIWQNLLRKAMAEKGLFADDDDVHF